MPVGPGETELGRCRDTIASLASHEPEVRWLVLVDDGPPDRNLTGLVRADGIAVTALRNPIDTVRVRVEDRIACGVLAGLAWVADHTDAAVVVKLDTDALVIGGLADRLAAATADPRVGLVGSFEHTCNGDPRSFAPWARPVILSTWLIRRSLVDLSRRSLQTRRLILQARRRGYRWGEHVLACAFAITRPALDAMRREGGLDDPLLFAGSGLGDDPILAILIRRAGFIIANDDLESPVFGVMWRGLPDTPERLAARGVRIIHSTKNDPRFSEAEIRSHFARRRVGGVA